MAENDMFGAGQQQSGMAASNPAAFNMMAGMEGMSQKQMNKSVWRSLFCLFVICICWLTFLFRQMKKMMKQFNTMMEQMAGGDQNQMMQMMMMMGGMDPGSMDPNAAGGTNPPPPPEESSGSGSPCCLQKLSLTLAKRSRFTPY